MGGICSSDSTAKYAPLEKDGQGTTTTGRDDQANGTNGQQPKTSRRSTAEGPLQLGGALNHDGSPTSGGGGQLHGHRGSLHQGKFANGIGLTVQTSPQMNAIDDQMNFPLAAPVPVNPEDWVRPTGLGEQEARLATLTAVQGSLFAQCLTAFECETLASSGELRACVLGARIFGQQERADCFYLIECGEVHLEVATDAAKNPDAPLSYFSRPDSPDGTQTAFGFSHAQFEEEDCYPLAPGEAFHTASPNLGTFLSPVHGRLTLAEAQASTLAAEAAEEARRAKEAREAHLAKREQEKRAKDKERSDRLKQSSDMQFRGLAAGLLQQMTSGGGLPGIVNISSTPHHRTSSMAKTTTFAKERGGLSVNTRDANKDPSKGLASPSSTMSGGMIERTMSPGPSIPGLMSPTSGGGSMQTSSVPPAPSASSRPTTPRDGQPAEGGTHSRSHSRATSEGSLALQLPPVTPNRTSSGDTTLSPGNDGSGSGLPPVSPGTAQALSLPSLQTSTPSALASGTKSQPAGEQRGIQRTRSSPQITAAVLKPTDLQPSEQSLDDATPGIASGYDLGLSRTPMLARGLTAPTDGSETPLTTATGSSDPDRSNTGTSRGTGATTPLPPPSVIGGGGDRALSPVPMSGLGSPEAHGGRVLRERGVATNPRRRTHGASQDFGYAQQGTFTSPPGHDRGSSVVSSRPQSPSVSQSNGTGLMSGFTQNGGLGGRRNSGSISRTTQGPMSTTSMIPTGLGGGHLLARYTSNPDIGGLEPHAHSSPDELPSGGEIAPGIVRVGILTKGQLLGLCGLHSAQKVFLTTAVVHSPGTRLICFPREKLSNLLTGPAGPRLKDHMGEKLIKALENVSWLRSLPPSALIALASLFQATSVPSGTILFSSGDCTADHSAFYFIVEGEVSVDVADERGKQLKKTIGPGGWLGELSVVVGLCRTGSAKAITPLIVRFLTRRSLFRFFNSFALLPLASTASRALMSSYPTIRDEQLLEQMQMQGAFARFCLKEFSAENIEYWQTAVRLRKVILTPSGGSAYSRAQVLTEAALLYTRYISERSLVQINLKENVRAAVRTSLKSGTLHSDTFRPAEEEILHLMVHDNFARFKASKHYREAKEELEAPQPFPFQPRHLPEPEEIPKVGASDGEESPAAANMNNGGSATPAAVVKDVPPSPPQQPWEIELLSHCARVSLPASFAWNESKSKTEEEILFGQDGYVLETTPQGQFVSAHQRHKTRVDKVLGTMAGGAGGGGDSKNLSSGSPKNGTPGTSTPVGTKDSDPVSEASNAATPLRPKSGSMSEQDGSSEGMRPLVVITGAEGDPAGGSLIGAAADGDESKHPDGVDRVESGGSVNNALSPSAAYSRAQSNRRHPSMARHATGAVVSPEFIRATSPSLSGGGGANAVNPFASASHSAYAYSSVPIHKASTSTKLNKRAKEVAKQFKHSPFAVPLSNKSRRQTMTSTSSIGK